MKEINRQWLLRRRPKGALVAADLEYREIPAPDPASLRPGELILRNRIFMCAPTMRNWMEAPGNSLYPSIPLGHPVMAPAGCEVVASTRVDVPVGSEVTTLASWQDFERVGVDHPVTPVPAGLKLADVMGPLGLNARTAYFGLLRVGQPKRGETLVVSGAAGSTGAIAAQIGKIVGCRVIGIAGGDAKCRMLTERLGLDGAVDYRSGRVEADLRALCPGGIDIFYDNVGGEILQAAIENMARFGRIVLCGQIAGYNEGGAVPGPSNMMRLIYGRIRMQGFLEGDYPGEAVEAVDQLRRWIADGKILHREDMRRGFMNLPEIFNALFDGGNEGTLLAMID